MVRDLGTLLETVPKIFLFLLFALNPAKLVRKESSAKCLNLQMAVKTKRPEQNALGEDSWGPFLESPETCAFRVT